MKKLFIWKLLIVVGVSAYILGTKAGRSRYRQISHTASALWNDPEVKRIRKRVDKSAHKALRKAEKKLG